MAEKRSTRLYDEREIETDRSRRRSDHVRLRDDHKFVQIDSTFVFPQQISSHPSSIERVPTYNVVSFRVWRKGGCRLPVWGVDGSFYQLAFDRTCKALYSSAGGPVRFRKELLFVLFHGDWRAKPATLSSESDFYANDVPTP